MFRETSEPEIYGKLFDEIASVLKYSGDRQTKLTTSTIEMKPTAPVEPVKLPVEKRIETPVQQATPPVQVPAPEIPKKSIIEAPLAQPAGSNDIVPATESTK
jgi:hypothetical protein